MKMQMTVLSLVAIVLLGFIGARGCQRTGVNGPHPQSLPVVQVKLGPTTFALEIANTDSTREMGLMHRDSMPADHGMIFVFPDEDQLSFWMKNTHIPLDIVYADADGKVVSIKQMRPLDETGVPSDGPAKYAVELNQGAAKRAGINAGDKLLIPDEARDPAGRRRPRQRGRAEAR